METLQRAFGMLALAIASTWDRENLVNLPPNFRIVPMKTVIADHLNTRMLNGDVTCIVKNPRPFIFIHMTLAGGFVQRCVWGMWLERKASWVEKYKTVGSNILTRDEAVAKGIPMPNESPDADE